MIDGSISKLKGLLLCLALCLVGPPSVADPSVEIPELECLIQPEVTVTVSSAVEGVVESVTVDRGDLVEKGQVIATLESSVEEAAVEAARARARFEAALRSNRVRLEFAQRELDRHLELQKQDVISDREMDEADREKQLAEVGILEAKETRRLAQLELKRAEAVLKRRTIRSPIDGVVVERILSPGEYADPPQVMTLAQIDPLRVEVFAPVSLLGRIAIGAQAEVVPEDPTGKTFQAKVTVVDRVVDAASGTFGVRLELPNPEHELSAGLRCTLRFSKGALARK